MILPIYYNVDISQPLLPVPLNPMLVSQDALANRIGVRLFEGKTPYSPGGSCAGFAVRRDGATVPITGTISGNEMYIDLPAAAYALDGPINIGIKNVQGSAETTVFLGMGTVLRGETGTIIDPGTIIPSVSALIAQIENAVASIPADYSALLGSIAHTFSASTAYTAGQYVWYEGELYRFNAAHSAGAWIGTDAARYTATDELPLIQQALGTKADAADVADLKSAIPVLANRFEPLEIIKNEYVKTNGSFAPYSGWFRTNKIRLPDNAKRLLLYIPANTQYAAWYDNNGDFAGALNLVGGAGIKNYPIPTGAKYFAISNDMQYASAYHYWGNEKMDELFNFLINDIVINSTQTITFTRGKPSSIVHKRNNVVVRTDEITYSGSVITETRTDAETGYWITITTDTQTLTTEVQ